MQDSGKQVYTSASLLSDVRHITRTTRGLQHSTSLNGVCQSTNYSTCVCVCTSKASCDTRPNVKDIREKHHNSRPGYASLMNISRPGYVSDHEVDPYRPFRAGHKDPNHMNSMSGKGLKDGQGHGLSFSWERGVTRPRSDKMETEWGHRKKNIWRSWTRTSAGLECVIQDHTSSELNYVSCTPSGVDLALDTK